MLKCALRRIQESVLKIKIPELKLLQTSQFLKITYFPFTCYFSALLDYTVSLLLIFKKLTSLDLRVFSDCDFLQINWLTIFTDLFIVLCKYFFPHWKFVFGNGMLLFKFVYRHIDISMIFSNFFLFPIHKPPFPPPPKKPFFLCQ